MKNNTKKEAKLKVAEAINTALHAIEIDKPARKTRKLLKRVSKQLTSQVKSREKANAVKAKAEQKKTEKKDKKNKKEKKEKVQLNHKAEVLV